MKSFNILLVVILLFMSCKEAKKETVTPEEGTKTEELAVMIDPFNPLMITEEAMNLEVDDYYKSWNH